MVDKKSLNDAHNAHRDENTEWYDRSMRNWRAWGSWFSWGSPVGLVLFFMGCAATFWIVMQALK